MNLKEWFKKSGMPKAEFARRVGINQATVYRWLDGEAFPTSNKILKIFEITNKEVKYFLYKERVLKIEEITHEKNFKA